MNSPRRTLPTLILAAVLAAAPGALACSVCYGEPDSPAARGLSWAIAALGGVVVCVLAGAVGFFVQANRKSAQLAASETDGTFNDKS